MMRHGVGFECWIADELVSVASGLALRARDLG
jgi:hypothetical protein